MATVRTKASFYYESDSAIWEVNRERVLLLAGAKVLLMQIAHPMVAEAVYNHSYVFKKPLLRLHRTLRLTLGMIFGTVEEVQIAIDEIERAHRPATGRIENAIGKFDAGASYNPRNPRQALWVMATLVEGAISAYETFVAPLSDEKKQEFIDNSNEAAGRLGIPDSYLPKSYPALLDYMTEAIESKEVIVSEKARKIAPFITGQSIPVVNIMTYPLFRLNVALLPENIREQYAYRLSGIESGLIKQAFAFSRTMIPYFPGLFRYTPEYHRAIRLKQNS